MSLQFGKEVGSGVHAHVYLNPDEESQVVKVIERLCHESIEWHVCHVMEEIERQNSAARVNITIPVIRSVVTDDIAYIYMERLEKTFQQKIDTYVR